MYVELPAVAGTPASRIEALKAAKPLVAGTTNLFTTTGAKASDLVRLATYIETGHDYADTHPVGKRRPVVHNTTVHVHAADGVDPSDVEHFLAHVANGDFAEFLADEAVKDRAEDGHPESDSQ